MLSIVLRRTIYYELAGSERTPRNSMLLCKRLESLYCIGVLHAIFPAVRAGRLFRIVKSLFIQN